VSVLSPNAAINFNLSLRFLDLTGNVQPLLFNVQAPATGATPFVLPIQTSEGFLLSATAFGATGIQRGQCWVQFLILRQKAAATTVIGDVILQGYVSESDIVAFPGTQEKSSIEGRGYLREVIISQPPVGTPATLTVPPATRWRLLSVNTLFTVPSATGHPLLSIVDTNSKSIIDVTAFAFTSTPTTYTFAPAAGSGGDYPGLQWPLPIDQFLQAGFVLTLTIEPSFPGTAQIGQVQVIVEEWAEL